MLEHNCERGAAVKGVLILLVVGVLAIVGIAYTFGYVIYPGEMGVRRIAFGPGQGFKHEPLEPGYHWNIPIYSRIYTLPDTLQRLELARSDGKDKNYRDSLEVQTTDGSSVNVDITIFYRLLEGEEKEHGGPADLIQRIGLEDNWIDHLYVVVNNELKKALGQLSTSLFYEPNARLQQLDIAHKAMNERLAPDGLWVDEVLLKRYTYVEERIDNAIFEKNLQEQEEKLNAASSKLAGVQAELEQVAAEWDAKVETLKVEGTNAVRVTRSEAELYETRKRAEGDLLVAKASAEVDRLRAGALASTAGAEIYVAREIAPLVGSLKGGVVSELDPYNLEEWMNRLGISAALTESEQQQWSQRPQGGLQ